MDSLPDYFRRPLFPYASDTSRDAELARRLLAYLRIHGSLRRDTITQSSAAGPACVSALLQDRSGPNSYVLLWQSGKVELIVRNDYAFGFCDRVEQVADSRWEILDWLRKEMLLDDLASV